MMKKYFSSKFMLVAAFMLIGAITVQAQGIEDDVPPNPEYGKCYAKCRMADQYETVTEKVKVKEESTKSIDIPAVFGTEEEKIMIKEASEQIMTVPAEYETISEEIMVKPASSKKMTVPATYTTNVEKILVSPESGKWVTKRVDSECFSKNPEDCLVKCYVKIPAKYNYVEKKVLLTPESTKEVPVPAEYRTISKRVLKTPATTKKIPIPAEYTTVTKTVIKSPASTKKEVIPAEFKDITSRKLVSKGGYSQWEEILCSADMNLNKVSQVQNALKRAGYDPGPVDGVMGSKTKIAMEQYQRDNGLPVGNMNLKTLEHLGIEY